MGKRRCENCYAILPSKKRKQCGDKCGTRYCGKKCQKEHWPQHKRVCALRKTIPEEPCSSSGTPYGDDDHLNEFRKAHAKRMQDLSPDSVVCQICGDTTSLIRTNCGIMCKDCYEIQSMPLEDFRMMQKLFQL